MKATLEASPSPNHTRNMGKKGRDRPHELDDRLDHEPQRGAHRDEKTEAEGGQRGEPKALGHAAQRGQHVAVELAVAGGLHAHGHHLGRRGQ